MRNYGHLRNFLIYLLKNTVPIFKGRKYIYTMRMVPLYNLLGLYLNVLDILILLYQLYRGLYV